MDIPFPNMPVLADSVAYIAASVSIIIGLMLVGWGRFWSRMLVGLAGVGLGFLSGDLLVDVMKVDVWVARSAAGSIFGVLGFIAAPFFWALSAGALCSATAGGLLAHYFLSSMPGAVPTAEAPAGGVTLAHWAESVWVYAGQISRKMWIEQGAVMALVMAPVGLIPLMLGLWKQRFITIVMTSLIGAVTVMCGAIIAMVQSDSTRWPKAWSGVMIPLFIIAGLWVCGVAVQYAFALAAARKKKAREVARAQSDNASRGRK
ncbi:MAG: hypothetical protein QGG42_15910 [Phycisphaerae bacterium]|jgi:hypothetical protein|nr:hypothetical protein [Phycisphaerae bacterium]